MMTEKKRMTLAEMAAASAQTGGRLVCPNCGCADFKAGKTRHAGSSVFRYRKCRHCGSSFITSQPQERIIRPVEQVQSEVDEFDGEDLL